MTGKHTTLQWEMLFPATNTALAKDRCFPKGKASFQGKSTGGMWTTEGKKLKINAIETREKQTL